MGRLLAVDPANELAHRGVIRQRLDARDRAGAIRQFDQMRTVLRDELGVGPDPAAHYINYWLDPDQRKIYCLVEAPDADTAHAVHREAHGLVADEIYEVQQG